MYLIQRKKKHKNSEINAYKMQKIIQIKEIYK